MQKSLWIILTGLFVAIVAPNALADTYSISFDPNGTASQLVVTAPNTIEWAPGDTLPSFEICYDGTSNCDETTGGQPVSNLTTDNIQLENFGGGAFYIVDTTTGNFPNAYTFSATGAYTADPSLTANMNQNLVFTDLTTTPEPSSLLLLSSGLIGLGFMKRKASQK